MSGKPIYQNVEFCSDPETLWAKIESHWDWLGVKPDGTFIVGNPKREFTGGTAGTVIAAGAQEGEHGVHIHAPLTAGPVTEWHGSEDRAVRRYQEVVAREREDQGPGIVRVQRIEDRRVIDDELVVRKTSNYR